MKIIILVVILIVSFKSSFSQNVISSPPKEIEIDKKTKTLRISTVDLSEKMVLDMKDEFVGWQEKVIFTSVEEYNREFILVHNDLMNETDLFDALRKYSIKKENILSYE